MTQLVDPKPRYSTETFDCIVELARTIRPQWDVPGLRQAIRDALNREEQPTLAELAYAVLRVAENFSVVSPAVIALDGPHWQRPKTELERAKGVVCPRCRVTYMPSEEHLCRNPSKRERVDGYIEQMRRDLRASHSEQEPA
jgi:hypothetical protein